MELRHLRYFVAVAEEGSMTLAADRRLHTAQPSLSRQIRDLEQEVGATLLLRSASGVTLTAAGKAFLEHAHLALAQVDLAVQSARRAAFPAKPRFALGFLTGQEMDWLAKAMTRLKDELPAIDVTVSSETSPQLAADLASGKLDLAFMRPERDVPGLVYRTVATEPLVVVLPSAHRLSTRRSIAINHLVDEPFIGMSDTAPTLRSTIDDYLRQAGVTLRIEHEADNLGMAMSLVASTGGVTLMPAYARRFLPRSITSRPLSGRAPTIDLVIGYSTTNPSEPLQRFLAGAQELMTDGHGLKG